MVDELHKNENIGQIKELALGWKLSWERAAAKTLIDRNDWVFVYLKSGFMLPGIISILSEACKKNYFHIYFSSLNISVNPINLASLQMSIIQKLNKKFPHSVFNMKYYTEM